MMDPTEYMRKYRARPCHVYVIESDMGAYKVGYSGSLPERLKTIQKDHEGETLSFAFDVFAGNEAEAREVERYAHWILRDQRLIGEWFTSSKKETIRAVESALAAVRRGETRPADPPKKYKSKLKPVVASLDDEELAFLEETRRKLGLRSMAAVIRRWIADARADTLGMEPDEMVRVDGKE